MKQDDAFFKHEQYGPEEMTFMQEEEVFPHLQEDATCTGIKEHDDSVPSTSIKEDKDSVTKEANGKSEDIETKQNGKRKLCDKQVEKKVFPCIVLITYFLLYKRGCSRQILSYSNLIFLSS